MKVEIKINDLESIETFELLKVARKMAQNNEKILFSVSSENEGTITELSNVETIIYIFKILEEKPVKKIQIEY